MAQIFKYQLQVQDKPQRHYMPQGSEIVFVGIKDNQLCFWAEHDEKEQVKVWREFIIVGTGHLIPNNAFYIGSVIFEPYVWHVYEVF